LFKGTPTDHTYHLHLVEVDPPVLVRPLQFRDYLWKHPDAAAEYGSLKKQLAKSCGQDMEAYVTGKTRLVENVRLRIEKENKNSVLPTIAHMTEVKDGQFHKHSGNGSLFPKPGCKHRR
jgi:hypothetical protein